MILPDDYRIVTDNPEIGVTLELATGPKHLMESMLQVHSEASDHCGLRNCRIEPLQKRAERVGATP